MTLHLFRIICGTILVMLATDLYTNMYTQLDSNWIASIIVQSVPAKMINMSPGTCFKILN